MKFYQAITRRPLLLASVMGAGRYVFPTGTQVSAAEASRPDWWHLNAEYEGETYDGYANSSVLDIGEVIATCNEGE
ncbi:hypothetical protein [Arthrobacter sp. ISL-95]|uniref:hypothetical protein n=1 Tax=Arthrobacter sp. ISL-95 TaxID=2819116 RepID=UPI001BEC9643|nr:hypothetical protein [Arthrobacter sp. ISL-95]MBT2587925.1 hypothetical protein [Arthrobacter sp. ISL-95]